MRNKSRDVKRWDRSYLVISMVVPHPAVPVGESTKVAVALIPAGMQWDQYQEIHFVFLVSPSY